MPTATRFTAFGRGNGFPFCIDDENVDSYFDYVTLGGYRKSDTGDPTQQQIDDSLVGAMKLFWNSYSLTGRSEGKSFGAEASIGDEEAGTNEEVELQTDFTFDPVLGEELTPIARVCKINGNFSTQISRSDSAAPAQGATAQLKIGSFDIIRMIKNGNFIGFGVHSEVPFSLSAGSSSDSQDYADLTATVNFCSIVETEPQGHSGGPAPIDPPLEVAYNITQKNIGGVHFLAFSLAENLSFDEASLSASDSSASVKLTGEFEEQNASASLSTISFWDYS